MVKTFAYPFCGYRTDYLAILYAHEKRLHCEILRNEAVFRGRLLLRNPSALQARLFGDPVPRKVNNGEITHIILRHEYITTTILNVCFMNKENG
jgi:hypothetical protein